MSVEVDGGRRHKRVMNAVIGVVEMNAVIGGVAEMNAVIGVVEMNAVKGAVA